MSMKKIIIGRNDACDIVIPDTSDLVSRKQAVLTYSFWGKMVVYDTSNNGTYVNGIKLENGKGVGVTRKDKINFARVADLDWNEVKDPYSRQKVLFGAAITALVVISVLFALWLTHPVEQATNEPAPTEILTDKGETTTTVVQVDPVVEEPQAQTRRRAVKKKNKKSSDTSKDDAKDLIEKDIDNSSPIIY